MSTDELSGQYWQTVDRMADAFLDWYQQHPNTQVELNMPEPAIAGSLCDWIDVIATTAEARSLLAAICKATDNLATVIMLQALLEVLQERGGLPAN